MYSLLYGQSPDCFLLCILNHVWPFSDKGPSCCGINKVILLLLMHYRHLSFSYVRATYQVRLQNQSSKSCLQLCMDSNSNSKSHTCKTAKVDIIINKRLYHVLLCSCVELHDLHSCSMSYKRTFQQWKYDYSSIMAPYSWCLFLSTNPQIIKRV